MQLKILLNYQESEEKLGKSDCAGCFIINETDNRKFAGNFWIANAKYIKQLPYGLEIVKKTSDRYAAEVWVLLNKNANAVELWKSFNDTISFISYFRNYEGII